MSRRLLAALVALGCGGGGQAPDAVTITPAPAGLGAWCDPAAPACDPGTTALCLDLGPPGGVCTVRCKATSDCPLAGGCCRALEDGTRGCFPPDACRGTSPAGGGCPNGVADCDPAAADMCAKGPDGAGLCTSLCATDGDCATGCCRPLLEGGSVCLPEWQCALAAHPGGPGTPCTSGLWSCDRTRAPRCLGRTGDTAVCTVDCAADIDCAGTFPGGCCAVDSSGGQGCLPSPQCARIHQPGRAGSPCIGSPDCGPEAPVCSGAPKRCTTICATNADCAAAFEGGCCGKDGTCVPSGACEPEPTPPPDVSSPVDVPPVKDVLPSLDSLGSCVECVMKCGSDPACVIACQGVCQGP